MHSKALVLPVLTYLFHRLEARFDGKPSLLIMDEAWVFLDDPLFAERIREWLKTLRKKNVAVVFATQSLADIEGSSIAPALIESCPSRIFLPNDRAIEPQSRAIYERFGLNERQIELIAHSIPKRDYYYQSQRGNRMFELGLGPVGLALCGASTPADHKLIDQLLTDEDNAPFIDKWLRVRKLDWAADLLADFGKPPIEAINDLGAELEAEFSAHFDDVIDEHIHHLDVLNDDLQEITRQLDSNTETLTAPFTIKGEPK